MPACLPVTFSNAITPWESCHSFYNPPLKGLLQDYSPDLRCFIINNGPHRAIHFQATLFLPSQWGALLSLSVCLSLKWMAYSGS